MKTSNPLDVLSDARRLEALRKTGLLDSPPEETFDRLTALACEILGVPVSLISLVDKERQFFKSSQGLPEPWAGRRETPLSHSFCQHVVISNKRLVINDARETPLVCDNLAVAELGVLAYVGIQLSAPDGQVLGSFCAIDLKPRKWSERELRIMSVLAVHATAEIAARWRFREMQGREQALRESEQRFALLAGTAPILIWMSGTDKLRTYFNKPWLEFTGRTKNQEIGNGWAEGVHPEDFQRCLDIYSQAIDAREEFRMEYRLRRADGEYRWVLDSGVPRFHEDGNFTGYIGSCVDITERREAEAKQQEAHDELDQRVQERTKDLEEANAALRSEVEERKRVEQKLRLAQFSVDHALDAVFWFKQDARIFYASAAACRSLGYSREELKSLTVHDFDPDFPKEVWAKRWERFKQDKLVLAESRHRTKSGKVFPVELAINYLEFDGENYCCAFARDITARKGADEKLRQSEVNHLALLNAIPDLIFHVDGAGKFLKYIPAENFEPLVAPEELLGKSMQELLPASVAKPGMECLRRALHTREPQVFEYQLEVRGDECYYEARFVPFGHDEALVIIRDITEVRYAQASLRESELRFRQLAEASDEVLWITALEPESVLYVSPAFEKVWGLRAEDLYRDVRLWTKAIHPEDQERVSSAFDLFATGQQEAFSTEYRIIRPDGSTRWILDQGHPIRDDQGEVYRISGVAQDITKRKTAEEALRQSEAQIQHAQKLESLGVLAGGIAHDFNNLLVGVLGNAEIALMDLPPESPSREELQHISTSAQRAADLTKQMLAYSGKGKFVVQALNLSKLVEEMAHLLEISISKKVGLKYNFGANLPSIEADATQVRQVVMNLIINAAEAVGERSGVVTVSTGVMKADRACLSETYLDENLREGDYVYLEVADTGCGMDEATKEKIFDPFFTTKFTGRGLGLAAVLGIMRGHKGAVKIDSHLNRGTSFQVLFPCSAQPAADFARASGAQEAWQGSGTVLVVDDEEHVRTVAKRMLDPGWARGARRVSRPGQRDRFGAAGPHHAAPRWGRNLSGTAPHPARRESRSFQRLHRTGSHEPFRGQGSCRVHSEAIQCDPTD